MTKRQLLRGAIQIALLASLFFSAAVVAIWYEAGAEIAQYQRDNQ